jgi:hypothetical protein
MQEEANVPALCRAASGETVSPNVAKVASLRPPTDGQDPHALEKRKPNAYNHEVHWGR